MALEEAPDALFSPRDCKAGRDRLVLLWRDLHVALDNVPAARKEALVPRTELERNQCAGLEKVELGLATGSQVSGARITFILSG